MNITRTLSSIILIIIFVNISGCSSSSKSITNATEGDIPNWYLNTPKNSDYIFAPATATSRDLELAISKATTEARVKIGRTMELTINSLQKKFEEEIGTNEKSSLLSQFTQATKTIVTSQLKGSEITKKKIIKDGEIWRVYVLAQYPVGVAQQTFLQQVSKNKELYTRFRSTQTFKELEKEIEKYNKIKEK